MRRLVPFAALLALLAVPAHADPHQVKAGSLVIASRTVRASIGHTPNTAAYLTIANGGSTPDRLVSASCACADKVEIHTMQEMKGMMMMGDAGPVEIPPHGSVTFHPGGRHLMLTGLKEKLLDGGQQEITLVFEHAGKVTVSFNIRAKIAADGAPPVH
ncbi:copper chaperone PCu(A)C [Phenylobacterium montanum]|uniref:Copper chaperone PCu(A)C n=1 Tax=Phenylobacterium montanum TaxID=2823693 RepID=A0A975FWV9_9CAUL|nr:copper chaperone PCu(A)C [Caulobacter sp. S6]QUD86439.1 copper chaperone PCu(A)C [Caulobacter sp. S6]